MLKLIGGLIIGAGVIWVVYALMMEVTVKYSSVYNTGLLAERNIYVVIGSAITIIGALVALSGVIVELIEKKESEKLDVLKNISNGLADHLEK